MFGGILGASQLAASEELTYILGFPMSCQKKQRAIELPRPRFDSAVSLEKVLASRRSVRDYSRTALTLQEISQLLWAGQGVTDTEGLRTAPSAGALYPLELYLVVGDVEKLPKGLYRYRPSQHTLLRNFDVDLRSELASAALSQDCLKYGAVVIVIAAVYDRTTQKYERRGIRYVHMEVGHVAQNIYLQAGSLDLGAVLVGAFDDSRVGELLQLPSNQVPLGLMPIGRKP